MTDVITVRPMDGGFSVTIAGLPLDICVSTEVRRGRHVITALSVSGKQITAREVRSVPVGRIEAALNRAFAQPPSDRPRLTRPDGRDQDAHSLLVAVAYEEALRTTMRPCVELAREAHVPVGTARRWVMDARRRGFLPPARHGRAG